MYFIQWCNPETTRLNFVIMFCLIFISSTRVLPLCLRLIEKRIPCSTWVFFFCIMFLLKITIVVSNSLNKILTCKTLFTFPISSGTPSKTLPPPEPPSGPISMMICNFNHIKIMLNYKNAVTLSTSLLSTSSKCWISWKCNPVVGSSVYKMFFLYHVYQFCSQFYPLRFNPLQCYSACPKVI